MENTQGTYVGQVNSLSASRLPGFAPAPEGSAFAAVNPPVNPARILGTQPAAPLTIVDHAAVETSDKGVRERIEALQRPIPHWQTLPICAVVTIANCEWRPARVDDIPKSITQGLGMSLSAHFAMVHNQSEVARQRRRWAVVTTRGTVLILCGIPTADRPTNPADFPPCVQAGLTYAESEAIAVENNAARFARAIVPREWSIAIRRADCVDNIQYGREGGAE